MNRLLPRVLSRLLPCLSATHSPPLSRGPARHTPTVFAPSADPRISVKAKLGAGEAGA
jgi:hypothetical protein